MLKLLLLIFLIIPAYSLPRGTANKFVTQLAPQPSLLTLLSYWTDGISIGNFESTTNWQELSGLAAPTNSSNSNYMWIISDSPANMLAAISKTNAANQGVYTLQTPPAYSDWEDIESAKINGISYLYIMDFGNNPNSANSRGTGIDIRIFRTIEPVINGSGGVISNANYIAIDAVFPAGNPPTSRDCEASFIDPDTGKIYIITKRDAVQKVYSLDHQSTYTGIQTLVYEGAMTSLPSSTTVPLGATATYAVDAAINKTGTEILIKNYSDIYLFSRNKNTQTIMQALQQSLVVVPAYVGGGSVSPKKSHPNAEPQGEGIAFDFSGIDLYSHSEYLASEGSSASRYPFFKYSRVNKVPTTVSFQDGVSSYTGTSDTYIWGTNPAVNNGSATTVVADITVGNATDERKALLKFDLSSIPTNATIISAKLELYLSAEGQGWSWYRVLVPWTESSTYTSLTGGIDNDGIDAVIASSTINGINLDTIVGVTVRDNMLISDVQNMVSNPSTNYGWLGENLDTATGDGVQFDSRESVTQSRRPKLIIQYIL